MHLRTAAVLTVLGLLLASPSLAQPPNCLPGSADSFSAIGARSTYNVPGGAGAVFIAATGGNGGDAGGPVIDERGGYLGGRGATIFAEIPVTGGETLDIVVGERGQDGFPDPTRGRDNGAGGGGGSFVSIQGTTNLLVAVGGGGGAGVTQDGKDASLVEDGVAADLPCGGEGGTGGNGGGASSEGACASRGDTGEAGGGGGWLSAGENGDGGDGGSRVSPPGDAQGGVGFSFGDGGFGGGGGGSSVGGGGGGGYSGGGGGYGKGADGGGGGGSFVAANGILLESGFNEKSGTGFVDICAFAEFSGGTSALEVPVGGPWAKVGLIALLGIAAVMFLRRVV